MKKVLILILTILCCLGVFAVYGCSEKPDPGDDPPSTEDPVTPPEETENPKLQVKNQEAYDLKVGDLYLLELEGHDDAVFTSADSSIAQIDEEGNILIRKTGEVIITAKDAAGNEIASFTIRVTMSVEGVKVASDSMILWGVGFEGVIEYSILPSNATNVAVEWESDNEDVAVVDQTGKVTAVSPGEATITVTTDDGGFTDTCDVQVIESTLSMNEWDAAPASGSDADQAKVNLTDDAGTTNVMFAKSGWNDAAVITTREPMLPQNGIVKLDFDILQDITMNGAFAFTFSDTQNTNANVYSANGFAMVLCSNPQAMIVYCNNFVSGEKWYDKTGFAGATTLEPTVSEAMSENEDKRIFYPSDAQGIVVTFNIFDKTVKIEHKYLEGYWMQFTMSDEVAAKLENGVYITMHIFQKHEDTLNREGLLTMKAWQEPVNVPVQSVAFEKTALDLPLGEFASLKYTITPAYASNQKVTFSSSNDKVVAVDAQGNIEALAAGEAVITVTTEDGTHTAQCTVRVVEQLYDFSIDIEEMLLTVGETKIITPSVVGETVEFVFESGNSAIAAVDGDGVVTAVSPGETAITVTIKGTNQSLTCKVVVEAKKITETDYWTSDTGSSTGAPDVNLIADGNTTTVEYTAKDWAEAIVLSSKMPVDLSGKLVLTWDHTTEITYDGFVVFALADRQFANINVESSGFALAVSNTTDGKSSVVHANNYLNGKNFDIVSAGSQVPQVSPNMEAQDNKNQFWGAEKQGLKITFDFAAKTVKVEHLYEAKWMVFTLSDEALEALTDEAYLTIQIVKRDSSMLPADKESGEMKLTVEENAGQEAAGWSIKNAQGNEPCSVAIEEAEDGFSQIAYGKGTDVVMSGGFLKPENGIITLSLEMKQVLGYFNDGNEIYVVLSDTEYNTRHSEGGTGFSLFVSNNDQATYIAGQNFEKQNWYNNVKWPNAEIGNMGEQTPQFTGGAANDGYHNVFWGQDQQGVDIVFDLNAKTVTVTHRYMEGSMIYTLSDSVAQLLTEGAYLSVEVDQPSARTDGSGSEVSGGVLQFKLS